MLRHQALIFDDFVKTQVMYTGAQHATMLGAADQVGIQAIVEQGGAGGHLNIAIEHSADGVAWEQKNPSPEIDATISEVPMSVYGGESKTSTLPSLEYVRLRIQTGETSEPMKVTVYAVLRDSGKGELPICDCKPCCDGCAGGEPHDDDKPPPGQESQGPLGDRAAAIFASRPHHAMATLDEILRELPEEMDQQERLFTALGHLDDAQRDDVIEYLHRVGQASEAGDWPDVAKTAPQQMADDLVGDDLVNTMTDVG